MLETEEGDITGMGERGFLAKEIGAAMEEELKIMVSRPQLRKDIQHLRKGSQL